MWTATRASTNAIRQACGDDTVSCPTVSARVRQDRYASSSPSRPWASATEHSAWVIHLPGGLMLAGDRERLDWLRMAQARGRYLGMELDIISAAEAKAMFPLMEDQYFVGALFIVLFGHVDRLA